VSSAAALARLLPDFSPAREHPAFRRLLAGGLLSSLGGSMTSFAVVLQVWDMSRSSLAVGLLGLTFVPAIVAGLLGGSAADAVDRRKLALVTSGCLLTLAVAGAADTLTVTFRAAMVQAVTPDEFRGRVSSVEYIIGNGGGPLGNVESGTVASLTTPAVSAISGGLGCLAIAALIALLCPAFVRYRATTG
jgi:MFS family permease